MNKEVMGIIASIIVFISFTTQKVNIIRAINIIGCVFFVIYGVLINAFSVWFFNGALCIMHIYKLLKN